MKPDIDSGHQKVADFYDNVYYVDASAAAYETEPWHLRALARRLALRRGEALLDVACGTCRSRSDAVSTWRARTFPARPSTYAGCGFLQAASA